MHFLPYVYIYILYIHTHIYICVCSKIDRDDVVSNVSIKCVCRQFVNDNQVECQFTDKGKKRVEK